MAQLPRVPRPSTEALQSNEQLTPLPYTEVNLIDLLQQHPIPVTCEKPEDCLSDFQQKVRDDTIAEIRTGRYPSQSISLRTREAEQRYKLCAGYRFLSPADLTVPVNKPTVASDPIDKSTIFRLASMSKAITAASLLQYVEQGKIDLDDPVSKYFPEYDTLKVVKVFTPAATVPVINFVNLGSGNTGVLIPDLQLLGIFPRPPIEFGGQYVSLNLLLSSIAALLSNTPNPVEVYQVLTVITNPAPPAPSLPPGTWLLVLHTGFTPVTPPPYNLDILTISATSDPQIKAIDVPLSFDTLLNPVRKYYTTSDAANKVTIRHLLTHTSGTVYYDPIQPFTQTPFTTELAICAGIARQVDPPNHPLAKTIAVTADIDIIQYVKLTAQVPLAFEPGTAWSYGPQLGIIGGILVQYEKKQHGHTRSLYEIQKTGIFEPLGMKSASYFIPNNDPCRAEKIANLVHEYTFAQTLLVDVPTLTTPNNQLAYLTDLLYGTDFSLIDGRNPDGEGAANPTHPIYGTSAARKLELGDAGLAMTTEDYQKFLYALRNLGRGKGGVRILEEATVREMAENQIGGLAIALNESLSKPVPLPNQKWGYGVQVGDQSTLVNGLSCVTMTWSGVYSGNWLIDFDSRTNLTTNSNSFGNFGDFTDVVNYIAETIACDECHE